MRLKLQFHDVREIAWGSACRLERGTLYLDRAALQAELLADPRLADVRLEVARPGESCRIGTVFDLVEPRAKVEPEGADFPGALTPIRQAGTGTTRVLRGMAVTVLDPNPAAIPHILDLAPPPVPGYAEGLSRYARLWHVIVVPAFAEGVSGDDAYHALRMASLRAAVYLARETAVEPPDDERSFELPTADPSLPRVAYVFQLHSHQRPTVPGEPLLYGDNCRHLLPTVLHPNEVLDGAVVRSYHYARMETYGIQNSAVVHDLYERHGRDLNFVGVVAYVANQLRAERERATILASNLVRYALRADGAIFTKSGGGAPNVDMALIADRCEAMGIRTTLMLWESGEPGAGEEDGALFNAPSLDAVVSIGANSLRFTLPAVERVITTSADQEEALHKSMTVPPTLLSGAIDHTGGGAFMGARY